MNSTQRVASILDGQPVDRLPAGEDFWGETLAKWRAEGRLRPDESPADHFGLDFDRAGFISFHANPAVGWKVIEDDGATVLMTDPNGVTTRTWRGRAGGVEHVACHVQDRATWDTFAKPHLAQLDPGRIPFASYRRARAACTAANRFFAGDGLGPFEMMHRLIGHENLLVSMALDPEWVADMVSTYTEFNLRHWEALFLAEGFPGAVWIAEDLGYKFKPFMSVTMFEELFLPAYVRMCTWLHGRGLKVILHSCGYIEPFLPLLLDAGIDCLEGMEVKAGMDLPAIFRELGDRVVWFGNIDIRALESNDRGRIAAELDKIRQVVSAGGRCMIHSDHSISPLVEYDTYTWFLEQARVTGDGTTTSVPSRAIHHHAGT